MDFEFDSDEYDFDLTKHEEEESKGPRRPAPQKESAVSDVCDVDLTQDDSVPARTRSVFNFDSDEELDDLDACFDSSNFHTLAFDESAEGSNESKENASPPSRKKRRGFTAPRVVEPPKKKQRKPSSAPSARHVRRQGSSQTLSRAVHDVADFDWTSSKCVTSLHPYQREAVDFFIRQQGRGILADEMGLGKTLQSIAIAARYAAEWPLCVITLSQLRENWRAELLKWLPELVDSHRLCVIDAGSSKVDWNVVRVVVVSYSQFSGARLSELTEKCRVVICDESHSLKEESSQRSQNVVPFVRDTCRRAMLLTGTALPNRAIELFNQVHAIAAEEFPDRHQFGLRYTFARQDDEGTWQYLGGKNLDELRQRVFRSVMLRRTKAEVLQKKNKENGLPAKRRIFHDLEVVTPELQKLMTQLEQAYSKKSQNLVRSLNSRAWKMTSRLKLPGVCELIDTLLQEKKANPDSGKLIVFAHHSDIVSALGKHLRSRKVRHITISSRVPKTRRPALIADFQKDSVTQVALLTVKTAGTGLTLTAADTVVFAELTWTPADLLQAEDRVHRIGQTRPVTVYYCVGGTGSFDSKMQRMLESKIQTSRRLLDGNKALTSNQAASYRSLCFCFVQFVQC
ncbi:MAG: hypothetical protein MHM6MM_001091 [Cercozoa sp. M6MM]